MQTEAVMEYTGGGQHLKAREEIAIRRPANLRVEAMSPLGVALVVAADGDRVQIFDPSKDTLMRGAATAKTLDRFARIPMEPQAAVRVLLGMVPDAEILDTPATGTSSENGLTVLSYREADGGVLDLGFQNGQLALVRDKSAGGQIDYEVHYSDYHDIGGVQFAYQVSAEFPATGTAVKFRFVRPLIDENLPDSLFVLSPGPATRQINLSRTGCRAYFS